MDKRVLTRLFGYVRLKNMTETQELVERLQKEIDEWTKDYTEKPKKKMKPYFAKYRIEKKTDNNG